MKTYPKFDAFIKYCHTNMKDNKLRELRYKNERDIKNGFYNYYFTKFHRPLIQIDLIYFKNKNIIYSIGFEYEDETCKINCMRPGEEYISSKLEEIKDFIDIFKKNKPMDYRLNKPRTWAYVSMTKKHKGIAKLPDDEFSKKVFSEMLKAKDIIEKLIIPFKTKGCIFY